jgi:hypothetical protein
MSTPTPPPRRNADELAKQLQASLRRQRPRPWLLIGGLLLVSALALGGLAWWLAPRPDPPPLAALAVDTLAAADESTEARAILVMTEGEPDPVRMAGQEVVFLESAPAAPGAAPREVKATTDEQGVARADWPLPEGATTAGFLVRYADLRRRKVSLTEGRVFRWPRDSAVVLVDVETALAGAPPARWTADPHAIAPRAGAGPALQALQKDGRRVVYLAPHGQGWAHDRNVQAWLQKQFAPGPALPVGPLLGPLAGGDAVDRVVSATVSHFTGPAAIVTADAGLVEAYRQRGVRPVWFGKDAPANVPAAADWAALPATVRQAHAPRK